MERSAQEDSIAKTRKTRLYGSLYGGLVRRGAGGPAPGPSSVPRPPAHSVRRNTPLEPRSEGPARPGSCHTCAARIIYLYDSNKYEVRRGPAAPAPARRAVALSTQYDSVLASDTICLNIAEGERGVTYTYTICASGMAAAV